MPRAATRAINSTIDIACAGSRQAVHEEESEMPAVTGKRYRCPTCGAEFIVTRGSDDAELRHDDTPLEQL